MPLPLLAAAASALGPMVSGIAGRVGLGAVSKGAASAVGGAASGAGAAGSAGSAAASGGVRGMAGKLGKQAMNMDLLGPSGGGKGGKEAADAQDDIVQSQQKQLATDQQQYSQDQSDALVKQKAAQALKALTGGALGMAVFMAGMPLFFKRFGASLLDAQNALAGFSGAIAHTLGNLERERRLRKVDLARRTAGSTRYLARGQNALESQTAKYEAGYINVKNMVAAHFNSMSSLGLQLITYIPAFEALLDLIANNTAAAGDSGPFAAWAGDIADRDIPNERDQVGIRPADEVRNL